MRVIALDVGERRIGVAASDPLGTTAQPLETIDRDGDVITRIGALADELGADRMVVGLPLLMNGSEGAQAGSVKEFAEELREKTGLPVVYIDERLTTRQAKHVIGESGSKPKREGGAADRVAAALILRQYLDSFPSGE